MQYLLHKNRYCDHKVFKNRLETYLFRRCYKTVWPSVTFPFPSHYLPPQNSGPRNSFYCLGHFKNVYDDDDDDVVSGVNASSTLGGRALWADCPPAWLKRIGGVL